MDEGWRYPDVRFPLGLEEAKRVVASVAGIEIQPPSPARSVSAFWGLQTDTLAALPGAVRDRIAAVIHLEDPGDRPRPEKTVIELAEGDRFEVGGYPVRSIKLKGVSPRIGTVAAGAARHIRLLGRGDIPTLVPYLNPAGEEEFVPFDVGEPYCAKKLRSVLNEALIVGHGFRARCAVMVPMGLGIYDRPGLLYKGEPVAFSLWGVAHPEDQRFDAAWRAEVERLLEELDGLDDPERRRAACAASIGWTRERLSALLRAARRHHAAGLVHHELQLDNHAFADAAPSVLDWEEAAHASQLTRAQFLESVLVDLYKLVCYACVLEEEYRRLLAEPDVPERSLETNWFEPYFERLEAPTLEAFAELLPIRTRERAKRGRFRELVLPLVERLYATLAYGAGLDWNEVARPFEAGYCVASPAFNPAASTTFDPKLFVRKGNRTPGGEDLAPPSLEIGAAEAAIQAGRFEDAIEAYRQILDVGGGDASHAGYLHHNLASLGLALRRDAEARGWFRKAYG